MTNAGRPPPDLPNRTMMKDHRLSSMAATVVLLFPAVLGYPSEPVFDTSAALNDSFVRPDADSEKCGEIRSWRILEQVYDFGASGLSPSRVDVGCPIVNGRQTVPIFQKNLLDGRLQTMCVHIPHCRYNKRRPFWLREINVLYCSVRTRGTMDAVLKDWALLVGEQQTGWSFKPRGRTCTSQRHMHEEVAGCRGSNLNKHGGRVRVRTFIPTTVRQPNETSHGKWFRVPCSRNSSRVHTKARCRHDPLSGDFYAEHVLVNERCEMRPPSHSLGATTDVGEITLLGEGLFTFGPDVVATEPPSSNLQTQSSRNDEENGTGVEEAADFDDDPPSSSSPPPSPPVPSFGSGDRYRFRFPGAGWLRK